MITTRRRQRRPLPLALFFLAAVAAALFEPAWAGHAGHWWHALDAYVRSARQTPWR
jgi:hypothetical protein